MKKFFSLAVAILMLLATMCSCMPRNSANNDSSGIANADDTSSASASDEGGLHWMPEKIPTPIKVDSFDVPVIIGDNDVDVVNATLYYNGKSYSSGCYSYIGSHNGRHYFQGWENLKNDYANYGYVCSCDENYENFERYDGIHKEFSAEFVMYNGLLYNWKKGDLYSYDIATKTEKLIYDGASDYYNRIDFISDDWVYTPEKPAINVKTGETVNLPFKKTLGTDKDGLIWGYESSEQVTRIQTYNKQTGDIKIVKELELAWGSEAQRDDNGDVWIRDNSSTLGYGYIKLFEFQGDDIAFARHDTHLSNGYYYYSYSPEGEEKSYLARINLKTGKTEYCPNIPFTCWLNVNPYFWGYFRPESK